MTPLPDVFVDTGLPVMPLLPWLAEYVYTYLRDASHPLWAMVTTELVADCAAVWLFQLRQYGHLVKITPALLEAFGRLPVNELQEGVEAGRAFAFVRCLEGARVFPWAAVTTRIEAGGPGLAARMVAVSYLPSSEYGFAAFEELGTFPVAVEPAGGYPMRKPVETVDLDDESDPNVGHPLDAPEDPSIIAPRGGDLGPGVEGPQAAPRGGGIPTGEGSRRRRWKVPRGDPGRRRRGGRQGGEGCRPASCQAGRRGRPSGGEGAAPPAGGSRRAGRGGEGGGRAAECRAVRPAVRARVGSLFPYPLGNGGIRGGRHRRPRR